MNDYKELIAELKEEWNACDRLISDKIAINLGMLTEKHYVNLAEDCCGEMVGIMQTIDCAIDAIEQLVKERDAAIADLKQASKIPFGGCRLCTNIRTEICKECSRCDLFSEIAKNPTDHWEWRGVKEDNDEID